MGKQRARSQKCPVCGEGGYPTAEAMRKHLEQDHCENGRKVQHVVLTVHPDTTLVLEIRGDNYQSESCKQLSLMKTPAARLEKQKDGSRRPRQVESSRSSNEETRSPHSVSRSPGVMQQNLLATPSSSGEVVPQVGSLVSGHRRKVSAVEVTPLPFECAVAVTPPSVAQLQGAGAVVAPSGGNKFRKRHAVDLEGPVVWKKDSRSAEDSSSLQEQSASPVLRKKTNIEGGFRENRVSSPRMVKPRNVQGPVKPVAFSPLLSAINEKSFTGSLPSVKGKKQQLGSSTPEPQPSLLSPTKESRQQIAGGRQVVCGVCNRSVAAGDMVRHMVVTHPSRDEPHVCPHCLRQYASAKGVKVHIQRFHSTDPKQKCPHCDKTFASAQGVKMHITRLHFIKPGL